MKRFACSFLYVVLTLSSTVALPWRIGFAQGAGETNGGKKSEPQGDFLKGELLSAFKHRSIGPALMSGRIADIAMDPTNPNVWFVAVGSGGVWLRRPRPRASRRRSRPSRSFS